MEFGVVMKVSVVIVVGCLVVGVVGFGLVCS